MTLKLEPFYPFKVLFFEVNFPHFHIASQCLFYKAAFWRLSGLFYGNIGWQPPFSWHPVGLQKYSVVKGSM